MNFTKRSTPPMIVCSVALTIGAITGCTRSEPVADETLPTVPESVALTLTSPASTAAPQSTAAPTPPTSPPTLATTAPPTVPPTAPPTQPPTDSDDNNTTTSEMTVESITAALSPDPESQTLEVMAWGDVDGDGDNDAVARITSCGASCGTELFLVINNDSTPTVVTNGSAAQFGPWFFGTGAAQSSVNGVAIAAGTVTLVGSLCGNLPDSTDDAPGTCNRDIERTATYQYADGALEPASIDPPLG